MRVSAFPQQHPSARGFFFSLLDRQAGRHGNSISPKSKGRKRRVKMREPWKEYKYIYTTTTTAFLLFFFLKKKKGKCFSMVLKEEGLFCMGYLSHLSFFYASVGWGKKTLVIPPFFGWKKNLFFFLPEFCYMGFVLYI